MKKRVVGIAMFSMVLAAGIQTAWAEGADEFVVGFDMSTDTSEYCLKFANYIEELAVEAGMTPLITQSDVDAMTQIQNAENWVTQGAQVIGGIWCDRDATIPVLDMCRENDLTLIGTLTTINGAEEYENYIYIGSENYEGGYLQGEYLSSIIDKEADNQIFYIAGMIGDQQSMDRRDGFFDALDENGVNYTEAATINVNGNTDDGVTTIENWTQAYGELPIVVGFNDSVILGGITAYEAAGYDVSDCIWIGFDGSDGALESLQEGKMTMTVFQNAYGQAEAFVDVCQQIRDGVPASEIEDINVPFETVTQENVSEFIGEE